MKYLFSFVILFVLVTSCKAQVEGQSAKNQELIVNAQKPKLVVGIVVDQMRYDYLTRFYDNYGEGGFKRMMNQGFNCQNNHFNYIPTKTAPGHASVFTGTTPKYHGIIGNDWYDKDIKKSVYCAGDDAVAPVGTTNDAGKMSPHRLKTTTFADENKLFNQSKSKTIGISIKDRGAIMPAGHSADAAYWFFGKDEGVFITSTYYRNQLPKWVQDFNAKKMAESYMKVWDTYYDIATYTQSGSDLNNFEGGFKGKETATFPYDLKALGASNKNYDILKTTPYGNSIVADFAIAAIEGENLGNNTVTDILTVSFSSTDYIGHNFGVNSKEIQDTYIRLDLDIERLLNALDAKVGKGNYTVFLTADHAAVHVPAYLNSLKMPGGYVQSSKMKQNINAFVERKFGVQDMIESISNNQIFLNRDLIKQQGLNLEAVQQIIVDELITYENIYRAYSGYAMSTSAFSGGVELLLQNGYNQKRSGDVLFEYDPAVISYSKTGSTHGSGQNYDTHVPLLFYGKGIKQGSTLKRTNIPDIAPTVCALLGISFPSGTTGEPLYFVLDKE